MIPTDTPSVSIVIVSRDRPQTLMLCLTGVSRLLYPQYEIIVVADPAAIAAIQNTDFSNKIKQVTFDEPNISVARNLGISAANGDVVAFIDDDAVPEPLWLAHLIAPIADGNASAAGGFVRGRNGISFQWKAREVGPCGRTTEILVNENASSIPTPRPDHAIKTEGTNMAIRRDVLDQLGGFDPAFKFYLDETDLNIRLAKAGHLTAVCPLAEVHHAYAPSKRRRANRASLDLTEIGASLAIFLRKHCPKNDHAKRCQEFQNEQHQRAIDQMVRGLIEPQDVSPLMATLLDGFAIGLDRDIPPLSPVPSTSTEFHPFKTHATGESHVLAGRIWHKRRLRRKARILACKGGTVSVFTFSHTALFHSVRFHQDGYWEQRGGMFGRSERSQGMFRFSTFPQRLKIELLRIGRQRGL